MGIREALLIDNKVYLSKLIKTVYIFGNFHNNLTKSKLFSASLNRLDPCNLVILLIILDNALISADYTIWSLEKGHQMNCLEQTHCFTYIPAEDQKMGDLGSQNLNWLAEFI